MNSAISRLGFLDPIKYGDNERSRLSGIGSKGNWFSRMSSKRVQWHVWEAKNMNSDYEWMLNLDRIRVDVCKYIDNARHFLLEEIGKQ